MCSCFCLYLCLCLYLYEICIENKASAWLHSTLQLNTESWGSKLKKVQISDDSYDPFGTITLNCFNFNKTKLYLFQFLCFTFSPPWLDYHICENYTLHFPKFLPCNVILWSSIFGRYRSKVLFLALLTLRQSMNAFCWASFMIGSQICFNFWVKLAALLWQLRQELFQPFLAVLPLRPWDCHFQPFDNCTIGTFFCRK